MDTYNGKPLQPLDENAPLYPGDVIVIKFAWLIDGAWYRAYQWSAIEKALEGRKDWRVVSYRNEGEYLWAEIEVLQQPEPELQKAGVPLIAWGVIAAVITGFVYALAKVGTGYLLERGDQAITRKNQELVEKGIAPPSILEPPASAMVQAATGFKALSYAALVLVAGWVTLRVFRR